MGLFVRDPLSSSGYPAIKGREPETANTKLNKGNCMPKINDQM